MHINFVLAERTYHFEYGGVCVRTKESNVALKFLLWTERNKVCLTLHLGNCRHKNLFSKSDKIIVQRKIQEI